MQITEVSIKLAFKDPGDKLLAFASVVLDAQFVVRDMRVIDSPKGRFVAMPSSKLTDRCVCGWKSNLQAKYCADCGRPLRSDRVSKDERGRPRLNPDGSRQLYQDIAFPITQEARKLLQEAVLAHYDEELRRSKEPGYACRYDREKGETT